MNHFFQNIPSCGFNFDNIYSLAVDYFPDNSHFVEVGAWYGQSTAFMAVQIINSGKKVRFDVVDTWEGSPEHHLEIGQTIYKEFLQYMEPIIHVINPIQMLSLEASKLYEDESLDFVFIDAQHEYEAISADIAAWYPKVKRGGIIGGHDYDWEGVKQAVDEHFFKPELVLSRTSWYVEK